MVVVYLPGAFADIGGLLVHLLGKYLKIWLILYIHLVLNCQ
jgi:hypothetical protein